MGICNDLIGSTGEMVLQVMLWDKQSDCYTGYKTQAVLMVTEVL